MAPADANLILLILLFPGILHIARQHISACATLPPWIPMTNINTSQIPADPSLILLTLLFDDRLQIARTACSTTAEQDESLAPSQLLLLGRRQFAHVIH
jgi:hypothetical protein